MADPVAEIRRMRDGDDPGNASALREALERIRPLVRATGTTPYVPERKELVDGALAIIDAALAAPARNCDRTECADVESAWATYCAETNRADCKGFARWLFAPANEGGDHA